MTELYAQCHRYFEIVDGGLHYKIWRKGLPKNCVGKRAGK